MLLLVSQDLGLQVMIELTMITIRISRTLLVFSLSAVNVCGISRTRNEATQ